MPGEDHREGREGEVKRSRAQRNGSSAQHPRGHAHTLTPPAGTQHKISPRHYWRSHIRRLRIHLLLLLL
eukprot:SM000383S14587  [mRNA]  locus=s383:63904:64107:- [translate_table: standard]